MLVQHRSKVYLAAALVAAVLASGHARPAHAADLSQYLSPDFCAVLVIHPQRISQSTLAEAVKSGLPKSMADSDPIAAAAAAMKKQKDNPPGFDADKLAKLVAGKRVHRLTLLLEAMPTKEMRASGAIVVQFDEDVDCEGIISAFSNAWESAEAGGTKYKRLKSDKPGEPDLSALAPDNRTLIAGVDGSVVKMLASNEGPRPLLNQLQKASFDNDIVFEFYAEPMWAAITKATGKTTDEIAAGAVPDPKSAELAKDVKSVSIRLNYSGKTLLNGEVGTGKDADTASMLMKDGEQIKANSKKQFEELKKNPPGMAALVMPMLSKVGDEVFEKLEIKAEGIQMTVNLPMPDSLPTALKALAQVAAPFLPAPPKGGAQ